MFEFPSKKFLPYRKIVLYLHRNLKKGKNDMETKKRRVVSYENMDEALAAAFNEKYPKGFSDYLPDLKEYPKPDGTSFYAVTIETDDAICLVKIKIRTDDAEEIERWLDSDDDDEEDDASGEENGDALPDDNISQYSNGDDDSAE